MDFLQAFEERYAKLNQEQRKAVDTIDGPVLVVAGPGSGKTEILGLRVANIIKQTDTPASAILCLTFTDAAAMNMRNRLADLMGMEAYKVAVHTFHSFGNEIINQNPEYFYKGALYNPADDLARIEILDEIFRELPYNSFLKAYNEQQGYVYRDDVINRIGELKKGGITPEEFKKIILENKSFLEKANPLFAGFFSERLSKKMMGGIEGLIKELEKVESPGSLKSKVINALNTAYLRAKEDKSTVPVSEWKKEFLKKTEEKEIILKDYQQIGNQLDLCEVYEKYQAKLHERSLYDYEDMLLESLNALRKYPELKYKIQEKYLYVLVDEFQDTSGVQMELLDEILDAEVNEGRPNVMVVGDDDQAIFKFQGANIENILGFHRKYKEPEIIVLTKNYRSTQEILNLVRKVILKGEDRLETRLKGAISKELVAENRDLGEGEILEQQFDTQIEEMAYVSGEIKKLIEEKGQVPKEIAVIAPKHKILEQAAKFLDHLGIPVYYKRERDLLQEPYIAQIITILEFVNSLNGKSRASADEYLPEILSFPFWKIARLDIWKIAVAADKKREYWLDTMLKYDNEFINNLAKYFIALGSEVKIRTAEEMIDLVTGIRDSVLVEGEQTSLFKFKSPYKDFYFGEKSFEKDKNKYLELLKGLQAFVNAVRKYKGSEAVSVNELLEFVRLHKKYKVPLNLFTPFNNNDVAVNLSTVHGAKGLEFDTVFVLNCLDEVWFKTGQDKLKFPANLPLSQKADSADDKLRLLYVALSRAKRNIYLTYHKYNNEGKEQMKLRFLEEAKDLKKKEKKPSGTHNLEKLLEFQFNINTYEPHNIAESELLRTLLQNYHLSVTHLNNFLDISNYGPQTFVEQNLLRFPQMLSPANAYGSAVHDALHEVYKELRKTREIPGAEFLLDKFEKCLYAKRLNKNDFFEQLEKGRASLKEYFEKRKDSFDYRDLSEFNFKMQGVTIGKAHVTGKIDRIKKDEQNHEIIVSDYKTGKAADNFEGHNEWQRIKMWKYKNQLIFYKLLVENAREFRGKYKVNQGFVEFVEPNKKGEIKTLELEIVREDVTRMSKLIEVVYDKIINLDFPDISAYGKDFMGISMFVEDLLAGRI